MKLFEFNSYQKIIENFILEQKSLGSGLTYQNLALELRIQKSYLSKVMKGAAFLNKDQAYLLAQQMKLNKEERDYLFLLIDYERVANKTFKNELKKEIKQIQLKNTQSDQYLDKDINDFSSSQMQLYYLLPEVQLIHLAFAIPKYQKAPEQLKKDLKLNSEIFQESVRILSELELIKIEKQQVILLKSNIHLKNDSPFFHQWQTQLKLKGIEWSKSLEVKDKYNFVASFTASDEDKENIRLEFLKFLNKVEKIVKRSDSKKLYQLNFDLFKWL